MARLSDELKIIKALKDAGATGALAEKIDALVSAAEAKAEERRRKDAVRQQRSRRVRKLVSESADQSNVTHCHTESRVTERDTSPAPFPPITPLTPPPPEERAAAAARARELELEIAKRVAAICRCPQLPTDPEHVAGWLAAGFAEQFILAVAKAVMGRRRPPAIGRIDYLDGPLADERERQRKLLPIEVRAAVKTVSENPDVRRTPATRWQAARDDGRAAFSEFTEGLRNGALKGSGGGG